MDSTAFYSAAAQVIPVLILILVVEYRLFGGASGRGEWWASAREPAPGERVHTLNALVAALFLGLLFAAEVIALNALRTGGGSAAAEAIVAAALLFGLFVVLLVPALPFVAILLDRTPAYTLRVWIMRRVGMLAASDPDPPKAGEGPQVDEGPRVSGRDRAEP